MRKLYNNLSLLLVALIGINMSAGAQTPVVYNYTGTIQSYTVPIGINNVLVDARGGAGGLNSSLSAAVDRQGYGSCVVCTLAVTTGQVLNIFVGGQGQNGFTNAISAGGFNGGGRGFYSNTSHGGGGGGGASDIRFGGTAASNRIIVAAGGGGAGYYCNTLQRDRGGDGGDNLTGVNNAAGEAGANGCAPATSTGGGGGPISGIIGGLGGTCTSSCAGLPGVNGGDPTAGGIGGDAGGFLIGSASSGGGGGGGWYGGGGGQFTGGGGGSNYTDPGRVAAAGVTHSRCNTSGNGVVTITPICIIPPIRGVSNICIGFNTAFSDSVTGGVWSSTNPAVGTIDAVTGAFTSITPGSTTIEYVYGPCTVVLPFTVNPLPSPITGDDTVCVNALLALSNVDPGGAWTSSNGNVTIGSSSGIVTGVTAGSSIITYTLPTTCIITRSVLVNPLPAPITGPTAVCSGLTVNLSDATAGGAWTSNDVTTASVSSGGVVTGGIAGTTTITYTIPTGACFRTSSMLVNPLPAAITGTDSVCSGLTTVFSDADPGGVWSSSNVACAAIGSATGIITGIGTACVTNITYTLPTGCIMTRTVKVNPLPGVITGPPNVCHGLSVTLSDATPGGIWSSSNTSTADIGSLTGVVVGVNPGSVNITYTLPTGCIQSRTFAVSPLPAPITGLGIVCQYATVTLSDSDPGGTWSTANVAVATAGSSSGIITGTGGGVTDVTYTLPTGCITTTTIAVDPIGRVVGLTTICVGTTITFSDSISGGNWISTVPAVASIDLFTGDAIGLSNGVTVISYILPSGCVQTATLTVNALAPITGLDNVCSGLSITLSDAAPGGTWISSNPTIATIGSTTGILTGHGVGGVDTVTYVLGTGCSTTFTVTVNPLPDPITGATQVCEGQITSVSDATAGGFWTSQTGNAAVGVLTGIVFGSSPGTDIITYTLPTGCIETWSITIAPLQPITGPIDVCEGSSIFLSDATPGGVWSTSSTCASVNSTTGEVTGLPGGPCTATIEYTTPAGCIALLNVNVHPLPGTIIGPSNMCQFTTMVLSDAAPGGVWTSSNTTVATVGSVTGVVTGVNGGVDTITYTLPTGCLVTHTLLVNAAPPIIGPTGFAGVCIGLTITLSDSLIAPGGWSSSNTSVATIGSTDGVVLGVATGTTVISALLTTGCIVTRSVTVSGPPPPISGALTVCVGGSVPMSDALAGGIWTNENSSGSITLLGGVYTGNMAGTDTITYTNPSTGCYTTRTMIVYDLADIMGPNNICEGVTVCLSDSAGGGIGTWSLLPPGAATIDAITGCVTGVLAGTTVITYTLPTGCRATMSMTVNPAPFPTIVGPSTVCEGLSISLFNVTGLPCTWSASNTDGVVSIALPNTDPVTIVGVTAGVDTITYSTAFGCIATKTITILPAPAPITGPLTICQGQTVTLSDADPGGTWWSASTGVATIGSLTGDMTGVAGGTSVISYMFVSTGCFTTATATVNPVPAITGTNNVCEGLTVTLANTILGGTWTTTATCLTVGSSTGVVTGITGFCTDVVTYTLPSGCEAYYSMTVNPTPSAIIGSGTYCQGTPVTLSDADAGGTWSTGDVNVVTTVGLITGIVTGTGQGVDTITYTLPTGCVTTTTISINPITPILNGNQVCIGSALTLSDATPGGTWSSSVPSVATIGSLTGVVTTGLTGTTIITYEMASGCTATITLTVNPLPQAITGPDEVCVGQSITLSDPDAGGAWTVSPAGRASITLGTGILTGGPGSGAVTVTYTLPTGCQAFYSVTVNPLPAAITPAVANVCVGFTINLSDVTAGGLWSSSNTGVADVGSTTGVVLGNSGGTSTITYQLTSTGCYVTRLVTVGTLPGAITGPNEVCVASSITLSDPITVAGGNWTSQFPAIATVVNTSLLPPTAVGTVTGVSAGVTNITYSTGFGCEAVYTVTVLPQPSGIITPLSDTMLCPGGFVALTAGTGSSLSYQWYNPGAIPGATSSTYIVPSTAVGIYSVTVTSGTTGCSITSRGMNVTVHPVGVTISPTGSVGGCSGGAGTILTATPAPVGVYTYQWLESGIPIAGAVAATYTATMTGVYSVIATNTVGCSGTSLTTTVTVNPVPVATVTLSGPLTFCNGDSVTFSVSTGTGYTYQWQLGGVPIFGETNSTYVAHGAGTIGVVVTNSFGCTATSPLSVVTVNPSPVVILATSGSPGFCSGGSFSMSIPLVANTDYQWYNGTTPIGGATNAAYTATASGTYKVIAVNTINGCTAASPTTTVTVMGTPIITPISSTSFCWGGNSMLSIGVPPGITGATYQWYKNGVLIPTATGSTYNATTGGNYTVDVALAGPPACLLTSGITIVTMHPLPNPLITFNDTVFKTQTFFVTYQWYRNNIAIPGATTSSTPAIGNGQYKVAVTDTNGCQSFSDIYILTGWWGAANVGIGNVGGSREINIYPNPAQTVVHIAADEDLRAVITSVDGKVLIDWPKATDINISRLADGMYMIQLYDAAGVKVKTEKLVKAAK